MSDKRLVWQFEFLHFFHKCAYEYVIMKISKHWTNLFTLSNRLQTRIKSCCTFAAKQQRIRQCATAKNHAIFWIISLLCSEINLAILIVKTENN